MFSAGTYLALPLGTLQSTLVVLSGVGIRITTLVAESLLLKSAFTLTIYDTCVVPISLTVGITRSGNLTFLVDRYLVTRQCLLHRCDRTVRTSSTQTLHQEG